eukprot:gene7819-23708_t
MQPVPLLDTVAWVCQLLQLSLLLPWYFLCMSQIGDLAGVWNAAAAAANAQRGYGNACITPYNARHDQNDEDPPDTRCFTFADMDTAMQMRAICGAGASTISPLRSDDDDENKWGGGTPAKGLPIVALVITVVLIVVHLLKQVGCKKPCSERFTIYEEADGDDALLDGTLLPTQPTRPGAEMNNLV